jgi:hypothetical protein
MGGHRRSWVSSLLLIPVLACDDPGPLAPSFMLVSPPASLAATAIAFNQIDLNWQDNSLNESGFEVQRSTTGSSGVFTVVGTTGPGATSYSDFGLAGSTQYCYRVRTFRTTGHKNTYSDFSSVACATTPFAPVPAAPSTVAAIAQYGYAINVTWLDNSSDETGFRVERAASSAGPWAIVGNLSANTTALFDNQVPIEQQVCYRVFAVNSYGDSKPSNIDCTAIPATPTNLAANVANGAVDLTWTDHSSVEDGFEVQRAADGAPWTVIANLPANTTTYHDATLSPDVSYSYFVRATRHGGTSGGSNVVQALIVTAPPAAPVSVDAVPNGSNAAVVYWQASSSNESGYRIERSTDAGASWVLAWTASRGDLSFADFAYLASEQPVCYRVIAFNDVGDSPPSVADCTTPPAAPTGLSATLLNDGTVELVWTDNSNVEDGYQIWVDDGYGDIATIASLDPNTTSFNVTDYYPYVYFSVVAVKDGGYSDFSDWVFPTSPAGVSGMRVRPPAPAAAPKPVLRRLQGKGLPR